MANWNGKAVRAYLTTRDPQLRLIRLPASSPHCNADEVIWNWVREEVTANTCFGLQARVRAHVDAFFQNLRNGTDGVKTRCRTVLQTHPLALARM